MILADTSGLLALLDEGEPAHAEVRRAVAGDAGPLLATDYVLAETTFLLHSRLGPAAEFDFLGQILAGALLREPLEARNLARAREILSKYPDQRFGLTDAATMALAERLGAPVLTLDRRHFGIYITGRGEPLSLLP